MLAADVNSLTSPETELPFEYYSLPFCKPPEGVRSTLSAINPGTILTGARIENSPYNFTTMVRSPTCSARSAGCCNALCKCCMVCIVLADRT